MTKDSSRQLVRTFHERHMTDGQGSCFILGGDGQLQARPEQRQWLSAHLRKAVRLLGLCGADRFLDLGCGEGYLTLPLASSVGQSIGVDFAISALRVLRAQADYVAHYVHLVVAEGHKLPLANNTVDKLLCNHVLEHVLDDDAVVQEMRRIVRPGGRILVGVPQALSLQVRLLLRLRRLFSPRARSLQLERVREGRLVPELVGKQSHIRFYSLRSVFSLLERNGFHVLRAEGVGLSARGPLASLFRRNRVLFGLSTFLGGVLPSIGDGVLVLAEREAM